MGDHIPKSQPINAAHYPQRQGFSQHHAQHLAEVHLVTDHGLGDVGDARRQQGLHQGAILGGLFLQFFPDLTSGLGKGLSALLYAVLLIAAIVAMPNGIAGLFQRHSERGLPALS